MFIIDHKITVEQRIYVTNLQNLMLNILEYVYRERDHTTPGLLLGGDNH